jgi:hypothetical protein
LQHPHIVSVFDFGIADQTPGRTPLTGGKKSGGT